jgi:ribosomal protein S18 acetylase RimI-like enzyme
LGTRTINHLRQRAVERGARAVYLLVNTRNVSAIHAYEKAGFVVAEGVTTNIGSGFAMDDYVMRLRVGT